MNRRISFGNIQPQYSIHQKIGFCKGIWKYLQQDFSLKGFLYTGFHKFLIIFRFMFDKSVALVYNESIKLKSPATGGT